MNSRSCTVLAVIAWLMLLGATTADADNLLRASLQEILDEQQLTGAAFALVTPDGITTDAVGYANFPAGQPLFATHRFHVGSVAKTVLATGVLRLVTEGRIGIDTPVENYLSGIRFDNAWAATHPVTVRHLLDHTSGLDDARLWQMFSATVEPATPLSHAYARNSEVLRIRSQPGSRFSYSNMGYGLLGMIIESVTSMRYETYLDEQLLVPLGMHESTFEFTAQSGPGADPNLAWGHTDGGRPHVAIPVMLRPAAQFTTTAHDLAVFAQFLMSDGDIDGSTFIDERLVRARGNPVATEAALAGLEAGYALGISRWDRFGAVGYCHSGNIVGFKALLCVYPDVGKAFGVAINTDSETANYNLIFEKLATELDLPTTSLPTAATPAADVDAWTGWYRLEPNRFQQFAYLDALFGITGVEWDGERLVLQPLGTNPRHLEASGGYLFRASDRVTPSHVLTRDMSGDELISDGYRTYAKLSPLSLLALWLSALAAVIALIWFTLTGLFMLTRHGRSALRKPEMVSFAAVLLLFVPVPLFLMQSFVQLGDMTVASLSLAVATGMLPALMLIALWRFLHARHTLRIAHSSLYASCNGAQYFSLLTYCPCACGAERLK